MSFLDSEPVQKVQHVAMLREELRDLVGESYAFLVGQLCQFRGVAPRGSFSAWPRLTRAYF